MFNPFKGAIKEETAANNWKCDNPLVLSADVFDESKVDFQLNGGPNYTDVLMATALFNAGKNKGFAWPLVWKWFYTFKSSELHTIEGVKSSFYQPSLDDIGARIWVHAYPTNGIDEYEGMPMFAEVGPLVMDDEILQLAQDYISKKVLYWFY